MKWSWRIGAFAGIPVYIHATFLLILGWVALSSWLQLGTAAGVAGGLAFILALFASVVLHEYGHALTARRFGIKTSDITLYPIGGVARLERMPDNPIQELWVALAGPAVNLVIAGFLFVGLSLTTGILPLGELTPVSGSFLERLMIVNLILVGFNMLPAFPMDGGRVLRALLAMRMEYTRATQTAANIGQGMAILFGFLGLFSNPFLLFIAFFVWIGASQENRMVQLKVALEGIPVTRAMLTNFDTLQPHESLDRAVQLILAGSQHDFPVVDQGMVVGVLTRDDLLKTLGRPNGKQTVEEIMRRDFESADSHEMLETAFSRLQGCDCRTIPVTHDGNLVGLVTMDNVGEFISIQAARRKMLRSAT